MATVTQGHQVFFCILARVAAELLVVHFQMRDRAAGLASPAVTSQRLLPQSWV